MTKATKAGRAPANPPEKAADPAAPDAEKPVEGDPAGSPDSAQQSTVELPTLERTLSEAEIGASTLAGLSAAAWLALDEADRNSLLDEHAEHERMAAIEKSLANPSADEAAPVAQIKYPLELVLRNNSRIPVVEMATYAHLQAGGSATVTVHSDMQLANLRTNLADVANANYFDPALLVIDGLPG